MLPGATAQANAVRVARQPGMIADSVSQPYQGDYGLIWIQPSKCFMLPCDVPAVVDPFPKGAKGSSSKKPEQPAHLQTPARFAKRQRTRERRKLFRAEARANKSLEEEPQKEATGYEARAVEVSAQVKLVVRNCVYYVMSSEEVASYDDVPLPSTFFTSTEEIDQWRRDYRKFRLGHHQGAKGEVTTKDFALENLAGLDLSSSLEMK